MLLRNPLIMPKAETYLIFADETRDLLRQMEDILLRAEFSGISEEDSQALFRCAHTTKGSAAMFGFDLVVGFTHTVENVLDAIRKGVSELTPDLISLLLECQACMAALVAAALEGSEPPRDTVEVLSAQLFEYSVVLPKSAPAGAPGELILEEDDVFVILPATQPAQPVAAPSAETQTQEARPVQAVVPPAPSAKNGGERRLVDLQTVKVPSERLDTLIDEVGEMVIAGAAAHLKAIKSNNPELAESVSHLLRLVETVRDTALRLRMNPIGEVFHRFPRVVRDLSRELNKKVELIIEGADTELDKSMVEKIADPLMHLLRNSLDHGIETPEQRLAAGKSETGKIWLKARHESGSILIEIKDDGAGLNLQKIREKALERGLIHEGSQLTDRQIWRLIMAPGFSTASQVTAVSGRGVGMDVVRAAIEALRGNLEIESAPGAGTTMTVTLPLTLAIIDGFQVGVGNNTFILPLDSVDACVELSPLEKNRNCFTLRGAVVPVVRLNTLFSMSDAKPVEHHSVVIVKFGGKQAAIEVDELHGECQAVIKPLGPLFEDLSGVAGTTILGTGDVALVLDVPQLVEHASRQASHLMSQTMQNSALSRH
ncbi:Hypothetical protein HDN1F_19150 [gamma proteobacterium HdN1]|nr:Hypothetical protein HDN1F_19150 [gamma proteobacterium HdN1]